MATRVWLSIQTIRSTGSATSRASSANPAATASAPISIPLRIASSLTSCLARAISRRTSCWALSTTSAANWADDSSYFFACTVKKSYGRGAFGGWRAPGRCAPPAGGKAAPVGYLPAVPGGEEGLEDHDELLSHEAAVDLVRERASAQRGRSEPDVVVPSAHWERLLPFTLPDPSLGGGARALVKRTIARLTRWQLAPLLRQLNEVRSEHHERIAVQERKSGELAARLEELRQAFERVDREAEDLADQQLRTKQLAASLETGKLDL